MEIRTLEKEGLSFQYLGDATLLDKPIIAVVGKRDVDEEVLISAFEVGRALAQNGFCVLNGLAVGCDAKAAEGALSEGGKVIAVLPCGLDDVYPEACKPLARKILEKGGLLLSQYPVGTRPDKRKFVERDRVQALLSNKVISVFCDSSGGTMHTLKYAYRGNKWIGCLLKSTGNEVAVQKMGASMLETSAAAVEFAKETYEQLSLF